MQPIVVPQSQQFQKRNPCKQTMREQEDLNRRIKLNQGKYAMVSDFMDRFFDGRAHLKEATALAVNLSSLLGLKLDRKAKRHKPAIICWFCENWDPIFPYLLKMKGINIQPMSTPIPFMAVPFTQQTYQECPTNVANQTIELNQAQLMQSANTQNCLPSKEIQEFIMNQQLQCCPNQPKNI